jgi:3-oxoacyl-[acyl-carrier-protein] synthase II
MGAVTPLGLTIEEFWSGLTSGKSGIGYITQFDAANFPVKIAAEVINFEPAEYMEPKLVDRTSRFTQFAIAAAKMAVKSARLDFSAEPSERIGAVIGTCVDIESISRELEVLKNRGPRRVSPLLVSRIGTHMAAAQIGMSFGVKGPNMSVNTACASGAHALATAFDQIQLGYADVMIAGGTEAAITSLPMAGLAVVNALSREPNPAKASRPFDFNRNGFIYGEGAGIMVLESYEHAINRGAPILAEFGGYACSFDAYNEAAPNFETQAMAMSTALKNAGVEPEDIDYINAHGTSTKLNDATETNAIKTVFGKRAYQIPVSSNKSMIGHIICAAGAIEAIATVLTIDSGIIPPTINYETPDPECDLDYVPNVARQGEVKFCLSNSFGMGGQNCCLVLKIFTGG